MPGRLTKRERICSVATHVNAHAALLHMFELLVPLARHGIGARTAKLAGHATMGLSYATGFVWGNIAGSPC